MKSGETGTANITDIKLFQKHVPLVYDF